MESFTLDHVNEMYMDVLRELGNIGAGNATTSLANMINEQINMNVPKVELIEASKLGSAICPEDEIIVGIFLEVTRDIKGSMMFLMFGQIEGAENLGVFCCGFFLSRCLSGLGVVSLRSAKSDGLLYHFASTAHERWVKGALYLQIILCAILMLWLQAKTAIFVLVAAGLTYLYYWWRSYRELNGITGDTAGYFLTLCEGAMVVAAAVIDFL